MPQSKNKSTHRVVLVKGNQQWSFEWDPGQEIVTVQAITEIAKSSDCDFDWFDAAMVCHEMSKVISNGNLIETGMKNEEKY